jgi:ribosomal protein L12E/L44/L45/RPP1/RPP2
VQSAFADRVRSVGEQGNNGRLQEAVEEEEEEEEKEEEERREEEKEMIVGYLLK